MVIIICEYCSKEFQVTNGIFRQRNPKFCSIGCYRMSRIGKRINKYANNKITKSCEGCNKDFVARNSTQRFCSRPCLYKWLSGPSSPSWKGGRYIRKDGYVDIYAPEHPNANNGTIREHRLVMENTLGRFLMSDETVHHINGNKSDNRPENLQLRKSNHGKGVSCRCADCGSTNIIFDPIEDK